MKLSIDPGLKKKCPSVALGCVTAHVRTADSTLELLAELDLCEGGILKNADPRAILEAPAISAARAGYRALGKDPARYRGSAEALLRRIISGKHFPSINSVVDIINLVSVESRLPIGLYDLAKVQGDIVKAEGQPAFHGDEINDVHDGIDAWEMFPTDDAAKQRLRGSAIARWVLAKRTITGAGGGNRRGLQNCARIGIFQNAAFAQIQFAKKFQG